MMHFLEMRIADSGHFSLCCEIVTGPVSGTAPAEHLFPENVSEGKLADKAVEPGGIDGYFALVLEALGAPGKVGEVVVEESVVDRLQDRALRDFDDRFLPGIPDDLVALVVVTAVGDRSVSQDDEPVEGAALEASGVYTVKLRGVCRVQGFAGLFDDTGVRVVLQVEKPLEILHRFLQGDPGDHSLNLNVDGLSPGKFEETARVFHDNIELASDPDLWVDLRINRVEADSDMLQGGREDLFRDGFLQEAAVGGEGYLGKEVQGLDDVGIDQGFPHLVKPAHLHAHFPDFAVQFMKKVQVHVDEAPLHRLQGTHGAPQVAVGGDFESDPRAGQVDGGLIHCFISHQTAVRLPVFLGLSPPPPFPP